jgi:hypothetical protein
MLRHTEIHTAGLFVSEPSFFEGKIATEKLNMYKSPDIDQIPSELIQAGGESPNSEIQTY